MKHLPVILAVIGVVLAFAFIGCNASSEPDEGRSESESGEHNSVSEPDEGSGESESSERRIESESGEGRSGSESGEHNSVSDQARAEVNQSQANTVVNPSQMSGAASVNRSQVKAVKSPALSSR